MKDFSAFDFRPFTQHQLENLTSVRVGETKLGETIQLNGDEANYVVLGISEDIGPQANGGFGGSTSGFNAFLKRFLNVQSNSFLFGTKIHILGEIISAVSFENVIQGRALVEELDEVVEIILAPWIQKGKIPIVIGGGHNNAYPIIKTCSQFLRKPLHVVNFDPHADFRALEGRHSGNSFSYAFHNQFLDRYSIIGLHQSYNSQNMLDELTKNKMSFSFFDDYLSGAADFEADLQTYFQKLNEQPLGLELDMDAIAHMPSSAFSPSGMTLEQARKYVMTFARSPHVKYFHLPEAAPKNEKEDAIVGKALCYLVTDFIKVNQTC